MKAMTRALHTKVETSNANPVVTPLYQCSAFRADSPYFYTRKDNPNISEYEQALARLECARHGLATTTGMTALTMIADLLEPGHEMVMNQDMYGCSVRMFSRLARRRHFTVRQADLSRGDFSVITRDTRLVVLETPTNPFLKTVNIGSIANHIQSLGGSALLVVDNTWATPIFQRPLEHGADAVVYSATKYFSGHSDVMGGAVITNHDDLYQELLETRFYSGGILDPHSAWLLRRSLQTLELRMRNHEVVTLKIRDFLADRPEVSHVYYPDVDRKQLRGYGGILFFDLREDLVSKYEKFTGELQLFSDGTGMAAVTSMVARPYSGSHASMTAEEKASIGLTPALVRLSIGLEDIDDLKSDLDHAFRAISG